MVALTASAVLSMVRVTTRQSLFYVEMAWRLALHCTWSCMQHMAVTCLPPTLLGMTRPAPPPLLPHCSNQNPLPQPFSDTGPLSMDGWALGHVVPRLITPHSPAGQLDVTAVPAAAAAVEGCWVYCVARMSATWMLPMTGKTASGACCCISSTLNVVVTPMTRIPAAAHAGGQASSRLLGAPTSQGTQHGDMHMHVLVA